MSKNITFTLDNARILAGAIFLATLTGCLVGPPGAHSGHLQTSVTFQDDYDYYPGYETYYSRNRHEYVYLEGNVWVRRPEPRGVSVSVFLAAPSVRMDFRDAPEQHHRTVIRSYPRTWRQPEVRHETRPTPQASAPEHRENRLAPQAAAPERQEARPEPAAVSPARHNERPAPPATNKPKKDRQKDKQDDAKDDRDDKKDDDRKDDRKNNR